MRVRKAADAMWIWVGAGVLALGGLFAGLRWDGRHRPRPMPPWLETLFLDNPLRRVLFAPALATRAWTPPAGARVGELGSGTGMVTALLARAVGPEGVVWAVDRQPASVARTRRRVAPWPWCTVAQADARRLPWPDQALDAVVSVAMIGEVPAADRAAVLAECRRVLKPGGRLVLGEYGPDPHFLSARELRALVAAAGFRLERRRAGFWQHVLVAAANGAEGPLRRGP